MGRAAERAVVVTRAERPSATLLRGAAGVGKTRLAAEVAAQLGRRQGWRVIRRQATRTLQHIPLGVFSDLLDDPSPAASGALALGAAYRALAGALVPGRSLLVIDDAALLDETSALVVQRLVENDAAAVVLTARSGEVLADGLTSLARAGRIVTVDLAVLSATEARALAASAAGGRLAAAQLDDVAARAGGVPLHVLALVAHTVARAGSTGPPGVELPAVAAGTDYVSLLLGDRSDAELEALGYVALGEPLELHLLEQLTAADTLERLEAGGLVAVIATADGDRRRAVRMGHPLYGEAVLAALGELRRRRLRRDLAAALDAFGSRRDDVLRAVRWRLEARDRVPAERLLAAASAAIGRGDLRLGEQLLRVRDDVVGSAAGACLLAGICLEQARPLEAAKLCEAADPAPDDATRARLAMHWAIACFGYLGEVTAARAVLDRFRPQLPPGPVRAELDAFDITIAFYSGDVPRAVRSTDAILADPTTTQRVRVWLAIPMVLAYATTGRTEQARKIGAESMNRAGEYAGEIVALEAQACCIWVYASLFHGEVHGCRAAITKAMAASSEGGDQGSVGLLRMVLGAVALQEGRFAEGAEHSDLDGLVFGGWHLFALAWRIQALALDGRAAEAAALLPSLSEQPNFGFHGPYNELVRGEVAAAMGDRGVARTAFDRAADAATANDEHAFALLARFRALGVMPSDAAADALAAAAGAVDGPLAAALGRAAAGWRAQDLDAIAAAEWSLDEIGSHLYALHLADLAAALAETIEGGSTQARRVRERAERRWAEARRASGHAVAAEPAGSMAADGYDRAAVALTPREQSIVELVRAGHRDRDIAAMLGISPRTVHAHLRACYRKLGVTGRAELHPGSSAAPGGDGEEPVT
ncbi:MAG: LuxR C-terminal-related transcriptional regulator [Acidimicrobiia bacterium]